jgi:hypothetical protein
MAQRQQIVDFIEEIVDAINLTQTILSHSDDGTNTTIEVANMYHARTGLIIEIDLIDYTIFSVDQTTNEIVVVGAIADPVTAILSTPTYRHGTPRAANQELSLDSGTLESTPFIYLFERIVENFDTNEESVIDRNVSLTIVFQDDYDPTDWTTDDHYTNVIVPQRRLLDVFVQTLEQSPKVGLLNSKDVTNQVKFGVFTTNKGSTDSIFNEKVSGPQLDINFQMLHSESLCDTPVTCRPATITDGGIVIVPSGGRYTCIGGGASVRVSNSNDSYDVTTGVDLELPNIQFTQTDGTPTSVPSMENIICNASAKDLIWQFDWNATDDTTETKTVGVLFAGTYTGISDDGGSGTITVSINGGAFVSFTSLNPLTLINTDTIALFRTTTTSDGDVTITGTYV